MLNALHSFGLTLTLLGLWVVAGQMMLVGKHFLNRFMLKKTGLYNL